MGAVMVGFLMKGPAMPPPADGLDLTPFRQRAKGVREAIRVFEQNPEVDTADLMFPGSWYNLIEDIAEGEASFAGRVPELFTAKDEPTDDVIQAEIEAVEQAWVGLDGKDVAVRYLSDGQMVIWAGDMTWGDEPQGEGYRHARWLMEHPFSELLGID